MSELGKVCGHGSLERKCEICDRDKEITLLKSELSALKAKGKEVADEFWKERIRGDKLEKKLGNAKIALATILLLPSQDERFVGDYAKIAQEALAEIEEEK